MEATERGACLIVIALAGLFTAHCSGSDAAERTSVGQAGTFGGTGTGIGGSTGVNDGGVGGGQPPEEQETEGAFRAPVASGKYLWSANPESNRIAVIDTSVLDVRLAEGRFAPTHVAEVPSSGDDESSAIVLNVLSSDATWFRVDAEGQLTSETFPVHAGANQWAVDPRGTWAVAWTSALSVESPDPTDGFQDISILNLEEGAAYRQSVGYRPKQVVFDTDRERLLVVAEPGVSVIDLTMTPPESTQLVELEADPLSNATSRDVSITPSGHHALVRHTGESRVSVVSMANGDRFEHDLTGPVTDLDLSKDGTIAVAVVREHSQAFVFVPSEEGSLELVDSLALPGETFGSVALSADASVAVLYTNATPNDRVTIVSLAEEDFLSNRTVSVQSPVRTVLVAPDGAHAITLMDPPEGSTKADAFAIVPTKALRSPKITGTNAPITTVGMSPPGPDSFALVATRNDDLGIFGAYVLQMPSLQVDTQVIASPPLAVGVIASTNKGYVAQEHPEGRITFFDFDGGGVRTLTGFELADKVRQ